MTHKTTQAGNFRITLHRTMDGYAVLVQDEVGTVYHEEAESLAQAEEWFAAEVKACQAATEEGK